MNWLLAAGYTVTNDLSQIDAFTWNGAGDMDCDGTVNGQDIDGFVLALFGEASGFDEYYAQYPNCDPLGADMNGDGHVNGQHIDGFVAMLFGG